MTKDQQITALIEQNALLIKKLDDKADKPQQVSIDKPSLWDRIREYALISVVFNIVGSIFNAVLGMFLGE